MERNAFKDIKKGGINRNILECKEAFISDMKLFIYVLIETYWNVKVGRMW